MTPEEINDRAEELVRRVVGELLKAAETAPGSRAALQRAAGLSNSFFVDLRAGRSTGIQLRNLFKVLLCLKIEPTSFLRSALGDAVVGSKYGRPACVERGLEGSAGTSARAEKVRRRMGR